MPLILGATAAAAGAQDNSCRFNSGDDPVMEKSLGTPTSTKIFTVSTWVKAMSDASADTCVAAGYVSSSDFWNLQFGSSKIQLTGTGNLDLATTQVFRDPGAWWHICMAVDTSQVTDTNRVKLYVNGTQITSFSSTTYPTQDDVPAWCNSSATLYVGNGRTTGALSKPFDGYIAEFCFVDGQQLAPTSFGEFDSDSPTIWKPIDVSGLTFGDNGCYLDFEDSANLGNDANGGTDLTETNLAAVDQCVDSPVNNFCTMNPLDNYYPASTFSEGYNVVVTSSGNSTFNTATIPIQAGKWYAEIKCGTVPTYTHIGISDKISTGTSDSLGDNTYEYSYLGYNGNIVTGASSSSYGDTYTTGDIIGIYLDLDNSKLYFGKNGTVQNSGTGVSISAVSGAVSSWYVMAFGDEDGGATATGNFNFGNGSFGGTAVSSGNTDTNGYGNFEYNPSSGTFDGGSKDFLAICTKNLGSDGG